MKYPRLHALRAERERQEREIREPVQAMLSMTQRRLVETAAALAGLERIVGSKVADRVVDNIGHEMASAVRAEIQKAVARAYQASGKGPPSFVEVRLSSSDVVWMDPASVERRVLDEWKEQTAPRLRFRALSGMEALERADITVLDVRVPELGYRQHIAEGFL